MSFHGGVIGCIVAIVLFALRRHIPMLSLGDVTAAVAPIGLFLGRIANFINGELWGRPTDVPWAMVFPNGGPIPRHPSQLYEAALEGVVLFIVLGFLVRAGALKRPGVVTGVFALGYGVARITCELFREPDVQLGFLVGRPDDGNAALHSADAGRHRRARCRLDPRTAGAQNLPRKMADAHSPLEGEIRRLIAVAGPMPLAEYMRLCLTHPQYGYYINRDPLGAGGDFVTSPEISQMFGELIGLWMASVWRQMGAPENIRAHRTRSRARHADARRVAGGESRRRFPRGDRSASGRDQPGVAADPGAPAGTARRADPVARHARRGACAVRASSSPTSSSMRCRCIRRSSRPTAGTSASSTSRPKATLSSAPRAIRCRSSKHRCRADCARLPTARSTNGAPTTSRSNSDGACAARARP